MTEPLAGKRALVCGASQGIGRACAAELARLGAGVTVVARDQARLREVAQSLPQGGARRHDYVVADFSEPQGVHEAVETRIAAAEPVHVLVNNTGGPPAGALTEASIEDLLEAFRKHVLCYQLLAQTVLPGMREERYGRIVNIISTSVILPIGGLGVSNTIRAAVANWARTLAGELAPQGITVNNVLPGYTDTDRLRVLFEAKARRSGAPVEQVREEAVASIPMRRLADPSEIAAVVGFLASPSASYVTGVNLPVDGGRTAVQ